MLGSTGIAPLMICRAFVRPSVSAVLWESKTGVRNIGFGTKCSLGFASVLIIKSLVCKNVCSGRLLAGDRVRIVEQPGATGALNVVGSWTKALTSPGSEAPIPAAALVFVVRRLNTGQYSATVYPLRRLLGWCLARPHRHTIFISRV